MTSVMRGPTVQWQRKRTMDILCVINVLVVRDGSVDTVVISEDAYN